MTERERRIAANEAVFRQANEELEALQRAGPGSRLDLLCECGREGCLDTFSMSAEAYERLRADPIQFAVRPGHELRDVETVTERQQEFVVVRKDDPDARELVRTTDPRER
jgi:predicted NBD/HSP70 family sugar kinase